MIKRMSDERLAEIESCTWTENDDGYWDTACGNSWVFDTGGPAQNHCTYCHGCGRPINALDEVIRNPEPTIEEMRAETAKRLVRYREMARERRCRLMEVEPCPTAE